MKVKSILVLSTITILLMAFSGPVSTASLSSAQTPLAVVPTAPYTTFLGFVVDSTTAASLAAPSSLTSSSSAAFRTVSFTSTGTSSSSYSPQPGDIKLTRDKVFLDMSKSHLIVSNTKPVSVSAVLVGNLPDPCHVLRVIVGAASSNSTINIQVYSLYNPTLACATVLKPFSVTVPLGSFTSGTYTVTVNGLLLGRFSANPPSVTSITSVTSSTSFTSNTSVTSSAK